jgi:hypothetical protein
VVKPGGVRIAHDWGSVPGTHVGGKRGVQKAVRVFSRRRRYSANPGAGSLVFLTKKQPVADSIWPDREVVRTDTS